MDGQQHQHDDAGDAAGEVGDDAEERLFASELKIEAGDDHHGADHGGHRRVETHHQIGEHERRENGRSQQRNAKRERRRGRDCLGSSARWQRLRKEQPAHPGHEDGEAGPARKRHGKVFRGDQGLQSDHRDGGRTQMRMNSGPSFDAPFASACSARNTMSALSAKENVRHTAKCVGEQQSEERGQRR